MFLSETVIVGLDQDFVTIRQDQDISPYAEHSTGTTITTTNDGAKTASCLPRLFSPLSPAVTWGLVTYPRIAVLPHFLLQVNMHFYQVPRWEPCCWAETTLGEPLL